MLERFMENCKKPAGRFGRLVLKGMNCGHGAVANWAFDRICWPEGVRILDVGCGGGGNIARLLKRCPHSRVDGVDYAPQSVEVSRPGQRPLSGQTLPGGTGRCDGAPL